MAKILSIYDSVVHWLASFGSDKYLHLLVGLIVADVVAAWSSEIALGVMAVTALAVAKEVADYARHRTFDAADALFTVVGGVVGVLMYQITRI